MKQVTLNIEKIVYGGWGMGRTEGKITFVPYTIPGEKVIAEIRREKKSYTEAFLREIKEVSPLRQRPFCNFFGQCGGCHFQHLAYQEQLRIKEQILQEFFVPLLPEADLGKINSFIPSPEDRGYRIRAQLKGGEKGGKQVLGFYEMKTHKIVEIEECPLWHPLANSILRNVKEWAQKWAQKEVSLVMKNLEVQVSPEEGRGIICMQVVNHSLELSTAHLLAHVPQLKGVRVEGERDFTRGEMLLEYRWPGGLGKETVVVQASYDSFIQVNMGVNNELIKKVLEWADLGGKERVLDLFCGIGNFTLPMGQIAEEVWGVDLNESAILWARRNAAKNGLKNCFFIQGTAEEGLGKLKKKRERIEVIVLDPPRAGVGKKALKLIVELHPRKIIYVSCEPPTLVRDIKILQGWGYEVQKIQALDMFPQTYHFEVIASLSP